MPELNDPEAFAFLQSLMTALFANDPQTLFERVEEAGKMLGAAAFQAHEEEYRKLLRKELEPIKDSIALLTPTVDRVGELLDKLSNEPEGLVGKMLRKALGD